MNTEQNNALMSLPWGEIDGEAVTHVLEADLELFSPAGDCMNQTLRTGDKDFLLTLPAGSVVHLLRGQNYGVIRLGEG